MFHIIISDYRDRLHWNIIQRVCHIPLAYLNEIKTLDICVHMIHKT